MNSIKMRSCMYFMGLCESGRGAQSVPARVALSRREDRRKRVGWVSINDARGLGARSQALESSDISDSSAGHARVYSNPKVYDIAFSFRDFASEAAFVLEAHYAMHSKFPKSFLEIGCGPARHSLALAETGLVERCVGIDVSKEMVEYAKASALEAGLEEQTDFVEADMMSTHGLSSILNLNGDEDRFDAAAIMLGTLSHCIDNESAIQTLSNIADCVKPRGLLILELGHPRDIFQGQFCSDGFVECWEVGESGDVDFAEEMEEVSDDDDIDDIDDGASAEQQQMDGQELSEQRVMVEYGREGDRFDIDRQVLHRTVGMSLFDTDGSLLSSTVETVEQRQFTLQELDLLARATGWEMPTNVYGDFDLNISLDDEESHRMIVVLIKTGDNTS